MVCDMPEPCKFPSLDSCQKSLPTCGGQHCWTYSVTEIMQQLLFSWTFRDEAEKTNAGCLRVEESRRYCCEQL